MKVRWSPAADQNLDDIVEHIALDNPIAAVRMDDLLIPHKSYRIVYELDDHMAVVHTARQWPPVDDEGGS